MIVCCKNGRIQTVTWVPSKTMLIITYKDDKLLPVAIMSRQCQSLLKLKTTVSELTTILGSNTHQVSLETNGPSVPG